MRIFSPHGRLSPSVVTLALLSSCVGAVDAVSPTDPSSPPPPSGDPRPSAGNNGAPSSPPVSAPAPVPNPFFTCAPGMAVPSAPMRRLARDELENTVRDLTAFALGDRAAADALLTQVASAFAAFQPEARFKSNEDAHGSFRRLDQNLDQSHVESLYALGRALGTALTTPERIGATVGPCAKTSGDATVCLDAFLKRFGSRVYRRPLSTAELTFYKGVYGDVKKTDPGAFADVITVLLNAPDFFYLVEGAGPTVAKDTVELNAFELASRLSYHFTRSMPDDALWKAAESGELLGDRGYRSAVERLFADPRTRTTLDEFVVDWLKLEDIERPTKELYDGALFKAFAEDFKPTMQLRDSMVTEVVDLFRHHVWTKPQARFDDVLTSELSFARTPDLARIYEVPVWDGKSEPPSFAKGTRPGLLTRAAMVGNVGKATTRPIMKGVRLRHELLCDVIPPVPANAVENAVFPTEPMTTRAETEFVTERDSACSACHKLMINGLGFVTENFDALGRRRESERVFDEAGKLLRSLPVDTRAVPRVDVNDETPVNDAAGLVERVVKSGKANACLARQYFRFTFGRFENTNADGCTLAAMYGRLTGDGGSLAALFRDVTLTPAFRQRVLVP